MLTIYDGCIDSGNFVKSTGNLLAIVTHVMPTQPGSYVAYECSMKM